MPQTNLKLNKLIDKLNPEQREAVLTTIGPELVIAGAGSGKTSVLTTRTALLMDMGIIPERILCLTFTKKAAEEMKKRIAKLCGDDARRLRMGTFHSVFISLLRPYAAYIGFPENFTILDEEDALNCLKRVIDNVVKSGRPPEETWTEEMEKKFKTEDSNYKPKTCRNIISMSKNNLVTADKYAKDMTRAYIDRQNGRPKLAQIFLEYRNTCFRTATMDFDDILLYTDLLLANNPEVCTQIASNFDYILVDEYQDTNAAQYSILKRLTKRNKNICVVGDDSQSIYAFRGARIENIFNFEKDFPNCKTVKLEQNYRSTKNIVEAANDLIANNENRIRKTCRTANEEGEPIELAELQTDRKEADYIAETIKTEMKRKNRKYKDFAVLYRTNSQSRALEDSFITKRIPYIIYSGTSFFERMEVKDQMAYFKLAVNPNDDESFRRVVNKPVRGVGDAAMERLTDYARSNGFSLWQALNSPNLPFIGLKPRPLAGLEAFKELIDRCTEQASTASAFEAAYNISNACELYAEYEKQDDKESSDRADNIRELIDSVKAYEDDVMTQKEDINGGLLSDNSLAGYLQNALLMTNADTSNGDDDRVNLMTVHCAKGLEFDTVFVSGMEEKLFPLSIEGTEEELEEERRLFYVAVTRARKNLFLTKADRRMRFGKWDYTRNSRFIEELMGELEYEDE